MVVSASAASRTDSAAFSSSRFESRLRRQAEAAAFAKRSSSASNARTACTRGLPSFGWLIGSLLSHDWVRSHRGALRIDAWPRVASHSDSGGGVVGPHRLFAPVALGDGLPVD